MGIDRPSPIPDERTTPRTYEELLPEQKVEHDKGTILIDTNLGDTTRERDVNLAHDIVNESLQTRDKLRKRYLGHSFDSEKDFEQSHDDLATRVRSRRIEELSGTEKITEIVRQIREMANHQIITVFNDRDTAVKVIEEIGIGKYIGRLNVLDYPGYYYKTEIPDIYAVIPDDGKHNRPEIYIRVDENIRTSSTYPTFPR